MKRAARSAGFLLTTAIACNAPRTPTMEVPEPTVDLMTRAPSDGSGCFGFGCFVANCAPGSDTIVSGTVMAPNGTDPIREALVYVPESGTPEEFPPSVSCEVCGSPIGGKPVTQTVTDVDGSFELRRVPVTAQTPIVIQKGRWRKTVYLNVGRCEKQGLPPQQGRLPRNQREGVLPRMAVAVGQWDAIECVLRHIGVDSAEFVAPGQPGAVHLYDNDAPGSVGTPGGRDLGDLLTDLPRMLTYNIIFINCSDDYQSEALLKNPTVLKNLVEYVARGGRLYVTDWSYDFIAQVPEFSPFICWNDDKPCTVTTPHGFHAATGALKTGTQSLFYGDVDQTTPGGKALTKWLTYLPTPVPNGRVRIDDPIASYVLIRQLAPDPVGYPTTAWLTSELSSQRRPISVTFNYPTGGQACGRVLFSSYHTREHDDHVVPFPRYCPTTPMIPQENVLEYLIFELGACLEPPG